jgi:hypothetical protein
VSAGCAGDAATDAPIRVLIADDHAVVRMGLRALIAMRRSAVLRWLPRVVIVAALIVVLVIMRQLSTVPRGAAGQEQQVWAGVRRAMPAHSAVFRPTWLPAPFRNAAYVGSSSETDGRAHNAYVVEYCAKSCENGDILEFVLNYASRAKGTTPSLTVTWHPRGQKYAVEARGITRADVLRVVAHLRKMGR